MLTIDLLFCEKRVILGGKHVLTRRKIRKVKVIFGNDKRQSNESQSQRARVLVNQRASSYTTYSTPTIFYCQISANIVGSQWYFAIAWVSYSYRINYRVNIYLQSLYEVAWIAPDNICDWNPGYLIILMAQQTLQHVTT